jgi:hypothetical protein
MNAARRSAVAIACAAGSLALLALQRALLEIAARLQAPVDLFFDPKRPVTADVVRTLPYHVIDVVFAPPAWAHAALIVVAVLQSLMLYALYRALRDREVARGERIALAVVAVAMLAIALGARTVNGFDVYADVGYAKLGIAHAYAPPATPFGPGFNAINAVWGTPMPPDSQGPLWVALTAATAGRAATLGGAIFALRGLEVIALLALIALLARRGASNAVLALVAFNPALYVAYVVNAHGDLFAATLLIGALAAATALPLAAALLVVCATLIKLPLVLLAPVVFPARGSPNTAGDRGPPGARIGYVAAAIVLAVAGSLWLGGPAYFAQVAADAHAALVPLGRAGAVATAVRYGLLIVAALALANVFTRGVVRRAFAWSFVALSPTIAPAALAWTLPYAALARRILIELLILLPIAAALLDASFGRTGLGVLATAAMLVYALIDRIRRRTLPIED